MVESKCIVCGAKIVSQRKRKYCDACKRDRAWDWEKETEMRKAKRKKEAELADLHSTMALSAKNRSCNWPVLRSAGTFSPAAEKGFAGVFGGHGASRVSGHSGLPEDAELRKLQEKAEAKRKMRERQLRIIYLILDTMPAREKRAMIAEVIRNYKKQERL